MGYNSVADIIGLSSLV